MGMTTDLRSHLADLFTAGPGQIIHPEFLHLEQVEGLSEGHRRLQTIRSRWDISDGAEGFIGTMTPGDN